MKNEKLLKLLVILPAFNEEKVIAKVLIGLKKELKKATNLKAKIVVVDDGSWDTTSLIAKKTGIVVLRHPINRGLGGALGTGLEYAKRNKADVTVTMDADGQHDPQDILKVIEPILKEKADVVVGIRAIKEMPWDRKIITFVSSLITFIFFGVYCSDTQSGFRGFSKTALDIIRLRTQRMEVSSELFHEIKRHKLEFLEIPIKVIYTSYSRQKGQSNLNALNILLKLTMRIFR